MGLSDKLKEWIKKLLENENFKKFGWKFAEETGKSALDRLFQKGSSREEVQHLREELNRLKEELERERELNRNLSQQLARMEKQLKLMWIWGVIATVSVIVLIIVLLMRG